MKRAALETLFNRYCMSGLNGATLFIVGRPFTDPSVNGTSFGHPFCNEDAASSNGHFWLNGTTYEYFGFGRTRRAIGSGPLITGPTDTVSLYVVVANQTTGVTSVYRGTGNSPMYTAAFNNVNFAEPYCIGGAFDLKGQVNEIRVYSTALTASSTPSLSSVVGELKTKWAIP